MSPTCTRRAAYRLQSSLAGMLGLITCPAWAAHSCSVTVLGTGALYVQNTNVDVTGTLTLTCSRQAADASTLSYRIKADNGLQPSGSQRRVRRGTSSNYLNYYLRRGTTVGGSASCGNSSNWAAPSSGTINVITGTLDFGANLTASATWGYCIRVRGNQGSPAAGSYTDAVDVFAQYPNSNGGALTPSASLNYTVGVSNQCVFNTFPQPLNFTYQAFIGTAQAPFTAFSLRCTDGLPWSIAVSPSTSTLLGLQYTITPTPASGMGNGNTNQSVTLHGNMPAGQAGTCQTITCSNSQTHTIEITY